MQDPCVSRGIRLPACVLFLRSGQKGAHPSKNASSPSARPCAGLSEDETKQEARRTFSQQQRFGWRAAKFSSGPEAELLLGENPNGKTEKVALRPVCVRTLSPATAHTPVSKQKMRRCFKASSPDPDLELCTPPPAPVDPSSERRTSTF